MSIESRISFEALAALPLVRQYEEAFLKATGISLKLHPTVALETRASLAHRENQRCWLGEHQPLPSRTCWTVERSTAGTRTESRGAKIWRCFAGLQTFTASVLVGGHHVATWVGDHTFSRRPSPAELRALARRLTQWGMDDGWPQVTAALKRGRVIPSDQFTAMGELLALFAEHLGHFAETNPGSTGPGEPRIVRTAREFVVAHLTERVTLREVAAAVNVSPFHLCRVFRTSTGMKFTEFVAGLRVDRAKALLADSSARISEVAYAAGFGSIPQFNAVFRRRVGISPTKYRAAEPAGTTTQSSRNIPLEMRKGPVARLSTLP